MIESDRVAFTRAFVKMCSCQGRPYEPDQCAAYFESKLGQYPLDSVLAAMDAAVLKAGRFLPEVGLIHDALVDARGDGRGQQSSVYASGVYRNDDGLVIARWRCVFCEDTGWRARMTDTGQLLTQDELVRRGQNFGPAREDGEPWYRMARCACRTQGQQRGAA